MRRIAQAKTGTGKTIAFLLPLLQRIIEEDPTLAGSVPRARRTTASDIRAIVISPTRELAEQIAEEARKLTAQTKIIVQTAVGGTQKGMMLRQTQERGCHVLVGTPGRLRDILEDPNTGVDAPKLAAFVLDEADRLLDQGFLPEIEGIMDLLPDPRQQPRQTMMFSATIPTDVVSLVRRMLKPGFQYVKCVRDNEAPTHERVPQKVVSVHGFENILPTLLELCQREIEAAQSSNAPPFKALVFFNSTAEVGLAAEAFRNLRANDNRHPLDPARILEIHGKLTQSQRTRTSDLFRRASSAILFSSDVTARGMDFPNVTHVIQVGIPQTHDQYVHRIGRTARAGKEGQGWLILSPLETAEAHYRLKGLPLRADNSLATAKVDMSQPAQLPAKTAGVLTDISEAHRFIDRMELGKAYMALLGTFQWLSSKHQLIEALNRLSRFGWGLETPPVIPSGLAQRLGLSRIPGVNIGEFRDSLGGNRGVSGQSSRRPSRSWEYSRDDQDSGSDTFGRGSRRGGYGRSSGQNFGRSSRERW